MAFSNCGSFSQWSTITRKFFAHGHQSIERLQNIATEKALLEYLPVIPKTPENDVCKQFNEYLSDPVKELKIKHIYAHANEQVYA